MKAWEGRFSGDRYFLPFIYTNVKKLLVIEFEIEPGTTVRDYACSIGKIAAEGGF